MQAHSHTKTQYTSNNLQDMNDMISGPDVVAETRLEVSQDSIQQIGFALFCP